jgi:hypothetical protein
MCAVRSFWGEFPPTPGVFGKRVHKVLKHRMGVTKSAQESKMLKTHNLMQSQS